MYKFLLTTDFRVQILLDVNVSQIVLGLRQNIVMTGADGALHQLNR
jgi:hypothetical protein